MLFPPVYPAASPHSVDLLQASGKSAQYRLVAQLPPWTVSNTMDVLICSSERALSSCFLHDKICLICELPNHSSPVSSLTRAAPPPLPVTSCSPNTPAPPWRFKLLRSMVINQSSCRFNHVRALSRPLIMPFELNFHSYLRVNVLDPGFRCCFSTPSAVLLQADIQLLSFLIQWVPTQPGLCIASPCSPCSVNMTPPRSLSFPLINDISSFLADLSYNRAHRKSFINFSSHC